MQGYGINCFGHIFSMVLICVLAPGTLRELERGHILGAVDGIVLSLDDNAMNLQSMAACYESYYLCACKDGELCDFHPIRPNGRKSEACSGILLAR